MIKAVLADLTELRLDSGRINPSLVRFYPAIVLKPSRLSKNGLTGTSWRTRQPY